MGGGRSHQSGHQNGLADGLSDLCGPSQHATGARADQARASRGAESVDGELPAILAALGCGDGALGPIGEDRSAAASGRWAESTCVMEGIRARLYLLLG